MAPTLRLLETLLTALSFPLFLAAQCFLGEEVPTTRAIVGLFGIGSGGDRRTRELFRKCRADPAGSLQFLRSAYYVAGE